MNLRETLNHAISILSLTSSSPRIDAEILMAKALNVSRAYLYTYPEAPIHADVESQFQTLLDRRVAGMPIAYLTGKREFWTVSLTISEATLIPRPETELLVEKSLALLNGREKIKLLDLGTGSGAIACAIAQSRPNWHITACDISTEALETAQRNASELGLTNISFIQSDWFQSITEDNFDAIVSNPPYLAQDDPHLTQGDLRFEPKLALVSGPNGLESLQWIIEQSYNRLRKHGLLMLEHGFEQRLAIEKRLSSIGYQNIQCWQDAQGHDRVTCAKK